MKGDFSRVSFDPRNHFSRVLLQQGRVTLDADPNEQASILLHYLQTLARDLIGPYGGPADHLGFALKPVAAQASQPGQPPKPAGLQIGPGRYYVQGLLCENESACDYTSQPDYTPPDDDALLKELKTPSGQSFWLYLDVWERYVSFIEQDHIREPALGGPDTCGRSKLVWQVKALAVDANATTVSNTTDTAKEAVALRDTGTAVEARRQISPCAAPLHGLSGVSKASMTAQLDPGAQIKDPCITAPGSRYRGLENQLYRVEIHQGGQLGEASFKWSRDNGSVATRWLGNGENNGLIVASSRGFSAGNWVEISDDTAELRGLPGTLVKLSSVSGDLLGIDTASSTAAGTALTWTAQLVNPKVRRWDQVQNDEISLVAGAVPIEEAAPAQPNWINLEDGVQVQFAAGGEYRSGDYWLIPARVATGDIDWPRSAASDGSLSPDALPPSGVQHYYAPLGRLAWDSGSKQFKLGSDCRCHLIPTNSCATATATATRTQAKAAQPAAAATAAPATNKPAAAQPAADEALAKPVARPVVKPKPEQPK